MKLNNKFLGFALTAIAAGALVSCSNELNDPTVNGKDSLTGIKLVKDSHVNAWSGKQNLTDIYTVSTKGDYQSSQIYSRAGEDIISYEIIESDYFDCSIPKNVIETRLKEKNDNLTDDMKTDFLYYAEEDTDLEFILLKNDTNTEHNLKFFYYDLEGQKVVVETPLQKFNFDAHEGQGLYRYYDTEGDMHYDGDDCEPNVSEPTEKSKRHQEWSADRQVIMYKHKGYKISIKKGYKFGFTWDGHNNTSSTRWSSVYTENDPATITDGEGGDLGKGTSKFHAVTFNADGYTFLGLEDWTDFDFQDKVFIFNGELKTVKSDNTTWGTDDGEEIPECPKRIDPDHACDHATTPHDPNTGYCPDCEEGEPCYQPCPNVDPDVPGSGCQHKHSSHKQNDDESWYCEECKNAGVHNDCNPEDEQTGGGTQTGCPNAGRPGFDEDGCGHTHTDPKNCGECGVNEGCNHKPDVTVAAAGSEVEVNLSINDKDNQGDIKHLVSKLSIHVRYPHDVRITIPVPAQYQVDQDDFYIFNQHYVDVWAQNRNKSTTATYTIGEGENAKNVTLTVTHVINEENPELSYIEVTTRGIDQGVFDYCREKYGDGLNFEVYSYFNYFYSVEEGGELLATDHSNFEAAAASLKYYLDQATIEFIDDSGTLLDKGDCPEYYINAFNDFYYTDNKGQANNNPHGAKDCKVSFGNSNQAGFYNPDTEEGRVTGGHLNNGEDNLIFKRTDVENDDDTYQHDHEFLWNYPPKAEGEE